MRCFHSMLIVFEGSDGSGKTFHAKRLSQSIPNSLFVRCPSLGGTQELLNQLDWEVESSAIAFIADRCHLTKKVITPALKAQQTVILSRYFISGYIYSIARGLDIHRANQIINFDMKFCEIPTLTLICDAPDVTLKERIQRRADPTRMDKDECQNRVRSLYREAKQYFPLLDIEHVDTSASRDDVSKFIDERIQCRSKK